MKNLLLAFISALFVFSATSCTDMSGADKMVNDFYDAMKAKNFDTAAGMFENKPRKDRVSWADYIKKEDTNLDFVTTFEQVESTPGRSNGVSVKYYYLKVTYSVKPELELDYETYSLYEKLVIAKKGENFEIINYEYDDELANLKKNK